MISSLIRRFDNWWLGQIDIGLLHMTLVEYYSYRYFKAFFEAIFTGSVYFSEEEGFFTGIDKYITTNNYNSISE